MTAGDPNQNPKGESIFKSLFEAKDASENKKPTASVAEVARGLMDELKQKEQVRSDLSYERKMLEVTSSVAEDLDENTKNEIAKLKKNAAEAKTVGEKKLALDGIKKLKSQKLDGIVEDEAVKKQAKAVEDKTKPDSPTDRKKKISNAELDQTVSQESIKETVNVGKKARFLQKLKVALAVKFGGWKKEDAFKYLLDKNVSIAEARNQLVLLGFDSAEVGKMAVTAVLDKHSKQIDASPQTPAKVSGKGNPAVAELLNSPKALEEKIKKIADPKARRDFFELLMGVDQDKSALPTKSRARLATQIILEDVIHHPEHFGDPAVIVPGEEQASYEAFVADQFKNKMNIIGENDAEKKTIERMKKSVVKNLTRRHKQLQKIDDIGLIAVGKQIEEDSKKIEVVEQATPAAEATTKTTDTDHKKSAKDKITELQQQYSVVVDKAIVEVSKADSPQAKPSDETVAELNEANEKLTQLEQIRDKAIMSHLLEKGLKINRELYTTTGTTQATDVADAAAIEALIQNEKVELRNVNGIPTLVFKDQADLAKFAAGKLAETSPNTPDVAVTDKENVQGQAYIEAGFIAVHQGVDERVIEHEVEHMQYEIMHRFAEDDIVAESSEKIAEILKVEKTQTIELEIIDQYLKHNKDLSEEKDLEKFATDLTAELSEAGLSTDQKTIKEVIEKIKNSIAVVDVVKQAKADLDLLNRESAPIDELRANLKTLAISQPNDTGKPRATLEMLGLHQDNKGSVEPKHYALLKIINHVDAQLNLAEHDFDRSQLLEYIAGAVSFGGFEPANLAIIATIVDSTIANALGSDSNNTAIFDQLIKGNDKNTPGEVSLNKIDDDKKVELYSSKDKPDESLQRRVRNFNPNQTDKLVKGHYKADDVGKKGGLVFAGDKWWWPFTVANPKTQESIWGGLIPNFLYEQDLIERDLGIDLAGLKDIENPLMKTIKGAIRSLDNWAPQHVLQARESLLYLLFMNLSERIIENFNSIRGFLANKTEYTGAQRNGILNAVGGSETTEGGQNINLSSWKEDEDDFRDNPALIEAFVTKAAKLMKEANAPDIDPDTKTLKQVQARKYIAQAQQVEITNEATKAEVAAMITKLADGKDGDEAGIIGEYTEHLGKMTGLEAKLNNSEVKKGTITQGLLNRIVKHTYDVASDYEGKIAKDSIDKKSEEFAKLGFRQSEYRRLGGLMIKADQAAKGKRFGVAELYQIINVAESDPRTKVGDIRILGEKFNIEIARQFVSQFISAKTELVLQTGMYSKEDNTVHRLTEEQFELFVEVQSRYNNYNIVEKTDNSEPILHTARIAALKLRFNDNRYMVLNTNDARDINDLITSGQNVLAAEALKAYVPDIDIPSDGTGDKDAWYKKPGGSKRFTKYNLEKPDVSVRNKTGGFATFERIEAIDEDERKRIFGRVLGEGENQYTSRAPVKDENGKNIHELSDAQTMQYDIHIDAIEERNNAAEVYKLMLIRFKQAEKGEAVYSERAKLAKRWANLEYLVRWTIIILSLAAVTFGGPAGVTMMAPWLFGTLLSTYGLAPLLTYRHMLFAARERAMQELKESIGGRVESMESSGNKRMSSKQKNDTIGPVKAIRAQLAKSNETAPDNFNWFGSNRAQAGLWTLKDFLT